LAGKAATKAAGRTERIKEKGDKVKECAIRQEELRIKVQGSRRKRPGTRV
jgi:hypothetical protein